MLLHGVFEPRVNARDKQKDGAQSDKGEDTICRFEVTQIIKKRFADAAGQQRETS